MSAPPREPEAEPAATPTPGPLERLLAWREAGILTHRYVDLKLGDLGGTSLLLIQAPLLGLFVGLGFAGEKESKVVDFILAMVAVWLGCFSACREVVKERLIFLRERRAGVPVRAYLVSKLGVLSCLAAFQCLVLVVLVATRVQLQASPAFLFLSLFATSLSAVCLGLLISSVVTSQSAAVALVPIVLIPQLIFSEVTIPNASELVQRLQLVLAAAWGYDMLRALVPHDPRWADVLRGAAALFGLGLGALLLAGLALRLQDDEA